MAINRGLSGINLLPKDRFENSSLGKFLTWAMSTGRVLVVLTEFVVLLAFGSRFYFDKKLNDISEIIDQKQAQIEAYSDTEKEMRKILSKQAIIKTYQEKNILFSEKYGMLVKLLPRGVSLEKLSIDSIGISLTGKADSELGFAQFLRNLKSSKEIAFINIKDTTFDQNFSSVIFTIQMSFK